MIVELDLDLSRDPGERWSSLAAHADEAACLLDLYVRELGDPAELAELIEPYVQQYVDREHRDELAAVARIVGRSELHVTLANFYYEALGHLVGCTAFACDTPEGPIHARNLDWWTDDDMLARLTCIVRASGGTAVGPYQLVSWPGFIGAFSGLAPTRFAITLNAVTSNEPPALAPPIVLVIRRALETCRDYAEAVALLESSRIAADCLLLVTGTRPGEMVVIERTSTRAALRGPVDGVLTVTNDYRALDAVQDILHANPLQQTACSRFDRATALVRATPPRGAAACLRILQDDQVQMAITVQHMVMRAQTGELVVELPVRHELPVGEATAPG